MDRSWYQISKSITDTTELVRSESVAVCDGSVRVDYCYEIELHLGEVPDYFIRDTTHTVGAMAMFSR